MKLFIIVLLLIHAVCVQAAPPSNFLVNGDFAQPVTDGKISGWKTGGSIVSEGNQKMLRLTGPNGERSGAVQTVALPAGSKSFKLEIKVRKGNVGNANYEVILMTYDAEMKNLKPDGQPGVIVNSATELMLAHEIAKPAKTWKTLTFTSKLPTNAVFFSVQFLLIGDGSVDFTDVTCEAKTK